MGDKKERQVEIQNQIPIWLIGWLFTLGFAKLGFVQGLIAIVLWPYYLGSAMSA